MNTYKAMSVNHRNYKYAQEELNYTLSAQQGGANNNAAGQQ